MYAKSVTLTMETLNQTVQTKTYQHDNVLINKIIKGCAIRAAKLNTQ